MVKKRLKELDSLRGLTTILVVFYHYTFRYNQLYPHNSCFPFAFYYGKYGAQAFFIISGFVIFMSLTKIEKPINFIVHRFIRLYPTFWFCVIFTYIMVSYFFTRSRPTKNLYRLNTIKSSIPFTRSIFC